MARQMNHARSSKRFSKTYTFELPAGTPKKATTAAKKEQAPTPEQIERQVAWDEINKLKSDAEVVLVNLKYGAFTTKAELKALLGKTNARFDERYLLRLLDYLREHRKIAAQGDSWKRA